MEYKLNIEILREFAKSTNRIIVDKEIPYPLSGIRTFQKYKRMRYVPELKGTPYLPIINPQSRELEKNDIENIFRLIEKIRACIN